ncbi:MULTISPECIES: SGNH/GDSL hydrolase family protein [unclassified Streptomyces]|uniref:SGNH/GDSL hydrolase family protein n=1 Tax=unclassified Streptomyces TaxID=2593676 RepID=UPI0029BCDA59|nr:MULTISPECIES: SGNH/GDSL hydrolase family protein [unclassified Streptomyces]MDX3768983.1 SGNH/GDSL hydrolase family protein [Streptomyces sp. AK08-01B]MDX3815613.1 SGNH/GDSL hydrolase family protein [Streptomyces sp. AK08-01A]
MSGAAYRVLVAVVALAAATLTPAHAASATAAAAPVPDRSVVTWAASADRLGEVPSDRTYRLVVRTSAGGSGMRIRVSNAFGDRPLVIGSAYAGLRRSGAGLVAGSNRKLRFDRAASVTLAPGEIRYSDPLPGRTEAGSDLAISLYVRTAGGPATGHGMALQTSYATAGDHAAEERDGAYAEQVGSWFYLDAVSVDTGPGTGAVVTLGDSITDGWQSTTDKNLRWPDFLARRLHGAPGATVRGVANAGISGNQVLADGAGQSALSRLDRDVLSLPGVRTVVLFEGVNDIKSHSGVTAAALTAGYRRIIDRAHAAGKCVVGATVLPYQGWSEWDPQGDAVRMEVNEWIRTSGAVDAVAEFDKVLRSPYNPQRLLPTFDGGDHLHPNDKGMQAMADSIDLADLECDGASGRSRTEAGEPAS